MLTSEPRRHCDDYNDSEDNKDDGDGESDDAGGVIPDVHSTDHQVKDQHQ